jgi:hypothetical protein
MISSSTVENDFPRRIPASIAPCNSMSVIMSTLDSYVRVGNRTTEAARPCLDVAYLRAPVERVKALATERSQDAHQTDRASASRPRESVRSTCPAIQRRI